ncbi:MAG: type II/IV secretion system ATPase subunit [Thermoplasmata archaeon]|nr:MAG: type II/IV secretion system ATPase subunit [Thermoplasmata archaeon]
MAMDPVLKPKKKKIDAPEGPGTPDEPQEVDTTASVEPDEVSAATPPPPPGTRTGVKTRKKVPEAKAVKKTKAKIMTVPEILTSLEEMDFAAIKRGLNRIFTRNQKLRPGFSASWVSVNVPDDAKLVKEYNVTDTTVKLWNVPEKTETLYQIMPSEYELKKDHVKLVHFARAEISEHFPEHIQLNKPEQARSYVLDLGKKLLYELAKKHDIGLGADSVEEMETVETLSEVLAKYTAGFGITEIFLKDPYIQDIYVDAPASENEVYITIGGIKDTLLHGKCFTNVILGDEDADSLLSRFRYASGRPFSEAHPVLETDLDEYNTRVTVIGRPLSPEGIAIALRRHSTDPWTLLKFIHNRSISPLAAGLISFLIDGRSTMLIAGSRGSGKSSLLGAIMLEFPESQRILTIEDTLELPGPEMQKLGYKLQSMYVQSSLGGKGQMTADEALRVSLRLGESAIVLGEVRGQEARTLYEAMRAGTAGSSVLGTFHGNSPQAVYERIVHDMGIKPEAFNATDIIIIAGLTRPGGAQQMKRRVTNITELVKNQGETGQFADLLAYDKDVDALIENDVFKSRSERIQNIADSWGMTYDTAIENIRTRAAYRDAMVEFARKYKKSDILRADWVVAANTTFWNIVDRQQREGKVNMSEVMDDWNKWFKRKVKYV